jgi:hypothetical protein
MESSEFMLQLAKELIDTRKISESTANAYVKTLYILNDKKPFKNLTFLKKIEPIDEKIAGYAETTKKAILATIVSVLTMYKDKPTFKKTYQHFYDKMMEKAQEAKNVDTSVKTDKQKENWVEWEDIMKKKEELSEEISKFINNKTVSANEYEKLLQHLILSLYSDIPPRRNQDYLLSYIVKKWNDKMPTDKNYLDLAGKQFVFNKYKTHREYGQQKLLIPDTLMTVINQYLKFHPVWKGVAKRKNEPIRLLCLANGTEMTAVNAITRILNKVFGKKVGSSLLRHIYLSDKYKDVSSEQQKDSIAMGHSVSQQREYVKTDAQPKDTDA